MSFDHKKSGRRSIIVIGTHLIGWKPSVVQDLIDNLSKVAQEAEINQDKIEFLFLIQPDKANRSDERAKENREWKECAEKLKIKPNLIYDFEYIPNATVTLAWNILQHHAFNLLYASTFSYLDPHLVYNLTRLKNKKRIVDGLAEFLRKSQDCDYLLGDYRPTINPETAIVSTETAAVESKVNIEKLVKQKFINSFSPLLMLTNWKVFNDLERVRSEFYSLSKNLYNILKNQKKVVYDFGLQMLFFAKLHNLEIQRVYIGDIQETGSYTASKMEQQLNRVDFQLSQLQSWISETPPVKEGTGDGGGTGGRP